MLLSTTVDSEEDKNRKEAIEDKNKLDQSTYGLEKLVKENKDKIPEDMATEAEEIIKNAREAVESGDESKIKSELEKINDNYPKYLNTPATHLPFPMGILMALART